MVKILYLGTSQFSEMMNTERWQLTNGMLKNKSYIFFNLKNRKEKNVDLYELWVKNGKCNFIILEDYDWACKLELPLEYINVDKISIPIWAFIADYWYNSKEKLEYYTKNKITGLIAVHEVANEYIEENFSHQIQKIINIPFSIDRNEFSEKLKQKEYDVLCSGFMGDLYPLRQKIKNVLKKNTKINTIFLEHPGYWKKNEKIGLRGKNYYAIMEKAKFVIATTGIYNISGRKHIEIVGSRAKIIGNTTGFNEHKIFDNFTLFLDYNMTDQQISNTIENAINNWKWSNEDEKKRQLIINGYNPIFIAKLLKKKIISMNKPDINKINVIILAAGKGTRIKKIALNTPKALVDIAGIPALILIMRRLIKQGFRNFSLVVNKKNEEEIENVVKNAFGGIDINLKTIVQPKPNGPAHAFFYGLKKVNLNNDTLLCLSDTLFDEDLPIGYDWVGTSFVKNISKWCWVEIKNKRVVKLFDKVKPPKHVKKVLIGLYYFKDSKFIYKKLSKIIKRDSRIVENEFQISQILTLYKDKYNIKSVVINSWVDCGTEENYFTAQKIFINHRYFNSIIIKNENNNRYVIKKGNKNKIQNEINWFSLVNKQNRKMVPVIKQSGRDSYQMNFINDVLLSSLYLYNPGSTKTFLEIIKKLYDFTNKNLWYDSIKYRNINIEKDCRIMYEYKPFKRLANWPPWVDFKKSKLIKINGENFNNIYNLFVKALSLSSVKNHEPIKRLIHGDFHFSNIFYNKSKQSFTFIDPRGSFGNSNGIIGDVYYDMAKLRHSYHGMYDSIVNGLYTLERKSKNDFIFKIGSDRNQYIKAIDQFIIFSGFDINTIKSIELGILLSLISLHEESIDNQLAFFLQAIFLAQELV